MYSFIDIRNYQLIMPAPMIVSQSCGSHLNNNPIHIHSGKKQTISSSSMNVEITENQQQ